MELNKITGAIEAILFASGDSIEASKIAEAVGVEASTVCKIIHNLQDKYSDESSGIQLLEMNDSFQFTTRADYADYVKEALIIKKNAPLSQAAMEILAIIAYNQPVTKSFIEQIRGIDSSQTVNSLCEKGLVEEAGRLDVPGRPISYKTTTNFLRNFNMKSLADLPPLPNQSEQAPNDDPEQMAM